MVMTDRGCDDLIVTIVVHLAGAQKRIELLQTALYRKVDIEYGERGTTGLNLRLAGVMAFSVMSQEERGQAT